MVILILLCWQIDSQSSEIEKLFEENSALSTSYEEAMAVTKQWENQVSSWRSWSFFAETFTQLHGINPHAFWLNYYFQVRECLKQNEELRSHLEKLRLEQASLLKSSSISIQPDEQNENSISNVPELANENLSLKVKHSSSSILRLNYLLWSILIIIVSPIYSNTLSSYRISLSKNRTDLRGCQQR